jgi:uncharacterized membrane protein YhaH (DUF805 family)
MRLTNAGEAAGFFLARAIVIGALYVITPMVLAPFYQQLIRSGGAALVGVATTGVALAAWLVTLVLFLALRAAFGAVPATVADPERCNAVISSGREIMSYFAAVLIITVLSLAVNAALIVQIYTALRQSGQTALIVPVSLAVAAVTSVLFFLLFIALRGGMSDATSADGLIGSYDDGASMGFGRAIATCFRKYAVFNGRASRSEYWFFMLFQFLLIFALFMVDVFALSGPVRVLTTVGWLILLLPSLAVTVRRLHDADMSGWWVLISLIPIAGPIMMIVFGCQRGTEGPNRFGMGPAQTTIPEVFA